MSKVIIDAQVLYDMLNSLDEYGYDTTGIEYDEELYDLLKEDAERFYVVENNVEIITDIESESGDTILWHELRFPYIIVEGSQLVTLRSVVDLYTPSNTTLH